MCRAAWCCADDGDHEAERWYRREAARGYARALERYDDVPRHQRARLTYLTGELWRRVGDERLAREWFGRVNDEVTDRLDQGWLIALAVLQRNEPRDWMP